MNGKKMTIHTMTITHLGRGRYLCECPTCNRRILLETDPYNRAVLSEGDPTAGHRGGLGGISMGDTQIYDRRQEPFDRWAEGQGL